VVHRRVLHAFWVSGLSMGQSTAGRVDTVPAAFRHCTVRVVMPPSQSRLHALQSLTI
jgi:hypothetical protein